MVLEDRTPLMVAATYGSVDVLQLILTLPEADVNWSCGPDKTTALHCAASGGSVNAVNVVKLLLMSGADPNCVNANGRRPVDVIVVPPKPSNVKIDLEELLSSTVSNGSNAEHGLRVSTATSNSNSPPLSSSSENGSSSSKSDFPSSPMTLKYNDLPVSSASEKKEYPIAPISSPFPSASFLFPVLFFLFL
ncbi:zinc finger CCCH domain-containing protein 30-like [Macadamia integrifolia]|uniref:zinc finger CCCH domain-containing protein 30-like n=1 Tax=Macadamia integrifolia TaxID=60698 RepID=UPI001C4E7CEF|nr:zinc finger CCCH domain-containing protein 30-like [Macadamia integrifolia]